MLKIAVIIFAVTAFGGIALASQVLRDKFAPWALSLLHAALGATGIVLTIMAVLQSEGGSRARTALILFVVTALGGFGLASFHFRQKLPPKALVGLHAVLALAGFGVLLVALA